MLVKICGTVSPHCYNNKNCPGFLIQEGKSKILLDCGNGITSEMNLEKDLNNLTVIISHLHKDHYGDILSLAYTTYVHHNLGLLDKKVKVFIPKPNLTTIDATYINLYGDKVTKTTESTINDYNFLTNLGMEQYLEFETYDEKTILNIDDLKISFARNPHQVTTYSTKVTSPSATIVYSSDTGFKGNILEEFARNTDLLICESSFLKGQVRKSDNHLYAKEAGLIACNAKPATLLLTHFWPSIPKENYLEEAKNIYPNTDVAEEGIIMVDLHTHSCYSDGEYTPNELILKAKKEGIKIISITDHDTVLGNKNITLTKEEKLGITIVPGIELSAKVKKGQMHILGYNIDINNQELNDKIMELKNNSLYSVLGILVQIKKDYGITFSTEEILTILNSKGNIGRPDIAKLCIKHKYSSTVKEAFNKYLTPANDKISEIKKGITYKECLDLIKGAGGIPVLAHPKTLKCTNEELENIIKELKKYGLEGIEVYHSIHTPEEIENYIKLANKYNLLISGGSDYHGPLIKPGIELGTGINNNIKTKKLTILNKFY